MVKLIASDIDGTLIPYGETSFSPRLFDLIRRLKEAGILFCPASGRQYHSLRRLFTPVEDEICFLCENGSVVFGPGKEDTAPVLAKTAMPREDALALARDIMDIEECEVLVSGENMSYVCGCTDEYIRQLREFLGNLVQRVEAIEEIPEEILKISVYCPHHAAGPMALLGPRWGEKFQMAEAGPAWLDLTLANKGLGIRKLCQSLGIDPGEVMAFGDNWNDVSMLEAVGTPWLMETAAPALRARFPRQCADVPAVLEGVLAELEH